MIILITIISIIQSSIIVAMADWNKEKISIWDEEKVGLSDLIYHEPLISWLWILNLACKPKYSNSIQNAIEYFSKLRNYQVNDHGNTWIVYSWSSAREKNLIESVENNQSIVIQISGGKKWDNVDGRPDGATLESDRKDRKNYLTWDN